MDGDAQAADAGLPAALGGFNGDAAEDVGCATFLVYWNRQTEPSGLSHSLPVALYA
jgi:hypothetical protein